MKNELVERLNALEKKYARLKFLSMGSALLMMIAFIGFGFTKTSNFGIIRAKGIIIEDEKGKDRILLGAPIHIDSP